MQVVAIISEGVILKSKAGRHSANHVVRTQDRRLKSYEIAFLDIYTSRTPMLIWVATPEVDYRYNINLKKSALKRG